MFRIFSLGLLNITAVACFIIKIIRTIFYTITIHIVVVMG